jgi:tyrosyl-tRNA synthetase
MKEELFKRGVVEIVGKDLLEKKIKSGKSLRVKHGVDPTTSDLHIGYVVVYLKLKELQDLGHKIVFLIGDFTARFGDPSDKGKSRNMRSKDEVLNQAKNYLDQVGKILDLKKTEIRYNGEWYDKMSAEELLHLMSDFSHAEMIERDMFQARIKKDSRIGLHELVYPVLQGYDSVVLNSELTVCGTDQLFNELQGRKLQEANGQDPQAIMTVPLLLGIDGKNKMSQSLGNYIGLNDSPDDQYGKIMSIPDDLIIDYFMLVTRVGMDRVTKYQDEIKSGKNPMEIKKILAEEIVKMYYGEKKAIDAASKFEQIFSHKELPEEIDKFELTGNYSLPQFLVELKLAVSNSEARRLINSGAVEIDGVKITEISATISTHSGMVIKVGKRRFAKIK